MVNESHDQEPEPQPLSSEQFVEKLGRDLRDTLYRQELQGALRRYDEFWERHPGHIEGQPLDHAAEQELEVLNTQLSDLMLRPPDEQT